MSRVKIEGNATGSGTLTISAPATNTDRTLTLPDTAGEVLVTDGTITIDDTNDRVGIGMSSPAVVLHIANSDATFRLEDTDTSNKTDIYQIGGGGVGISDGTTERMRIDSSGNLLVNTTNSSSDNIGVRATYDSGSSTGFAFSSTSSNRCIISNRTTDGTNISIRRSGSEVGSISVTTSATSYNTSSDYRLKENVVDMSSAIDRVKALQPRRFNFIADEDDTTVDGFIAHEVSDVVPEAISGEKDATKEEEYEVTPAVLDDDGNVVTEAVMGTRTVPDYQGIDQSKLVPLLTGALQEAIAKIETLETTVADLTTRLEALENA